MRTYLFKLKWYILLDCLLMSVSYLAMAMLPLFTQKLVAGEYGVALAGYAGASTTYLVMNYLAMRVQWLRAIKFSTMLKTDWFHQVMARPYQVFKRQTVEDYLAFQSNDLDALEKDYLPPLVSFCQQVIRLLIFAIVIILTIDWQVAMILLICSAITIQVPRYFGRLTASKQQIYLRSQGNYYHVLGDLFKGFNHYNQVTAKGFKRQQSTALYGLQADYLGYGLSKIKGIVCNGLSIELTSLALLGYLAYSLQQGLVSIGAVVASLGYLSAFYEPLNEILYDLQMIATTKPIVRSFDRIMSEERISKLPLSQFNQVTIHQLKVISPNLSVSDLHINYGDKICLLGANGAGKTSFFNVLRGMQDYQGDVFIDGQLPQSLAGQFASIMQDEHIFDATIEANLTVFGSFPVSGDTSFVLEDSSAYLSGGERQRLAIDRAINSGSPLLILDEPFSAMDAIQLDRALKRLLSLPHAVILTMHDRQQHVSQFNKIWRVRDGVISEEHIN